MIRKKILQIIPSLEIAGAEIMVENLTYSLISKGYDVSIVSLYNSKSAITNRLEESNIKIYYLEKNNGLDLSIFLRIYNVFSIEKPDIIHTHLYTLKYAIPGAVMLKIPKHIHTFHSVADKEASTNERKINKIFYKFFNVVPVAISPKIKQTILNEYNISENEVPMIYNGINLSNCIEKDSYQLSKPINITHIGRFSKEKNHSDIIKAFKIIHDNEPNTILKLIGTGELKEDIMKQTEELSLTDEVEFLGVQSNVYGYLNETDIFILPSLWEGMPMTLIEAMGTGLPIVASKVGGIVDMIKNNETGVLIDTNHQNIAAAVLKLIRNEKLRRKLGKNAKIAADKFSSVTMAEKYSGIYNKL